MSPRDLFTPLLCSVLTLAAGVPLAAAQEEPSQSAEDESSEDSAFAFRDNSFLVEEAYNQDPGMVQHIFNWIPTWDRNRGTRSRNLDFVFTQEWPLGSQTHQISYTLPFQHVAEAGDEDFEAGGMCDMLLNYRLQVLDGEDEPLAFAPRFSLILPTGDEDKGLGNGRVGYQLNLPVSYQVGRWAYHFNAGLTVVPDVVAGLAPQYRANGQTLNGYNFGFSVIHALTPKFHLMLETVALLNENLLEEATQDRTTEVIVSPGFRWMPYTRGDTQWVTGLGVPVGVSRDAPNIGAIFYLSLEHRFRPKDED
jgi:hypothetical protein